MDRTSMKLNADKNKVDDKKEEEETHEATRPTNLNMATSTTSSRDNSRRYNVDDIRFTPSPIDVQPRMFQPGSIISTATFARIEAEVDDKLKLRMKVEEEEEKEHEIYVTDRQGLNDMLYEAREEEIGQLSQLNTTDRPAINEETAQLIVEQLNLALNTTATITNINVNDTNDQQILTSGSASASMASTQQQRPYPPVHQSGVVADHDRPFADYGHLDRQTIVRECRFNFQQPTKPHSLRLHAKSFAITAWTHVSKEVVMNAIKDEFGIENIQYICISEEIGEFNHQDHLHIQIIFKDQIDRRKPFLDKITRTYCHYEVTRNDLAWNEYIKKEGNYIEFNQFKSVLTRGEKDWPPSTSSTTVAAAAAPSPTPASSPVSTSFNQGQPPVPRATTTTTARRTTVRAQAEERRQRTEDITKQAFNLAQTDMDAAMALIQRYMPVKFLDRSTFNLNTFKYIYLIAQRSADRRGDIHKEYVWPISFPDCTQALREAMNLWIEHNFSLTKRAKCLILIGPTRSGKTSFALSLPGRPNYFRGRWNLDLWNDYARYSVYDDIPWDQFEKLNFPFKKHLFCQNGSTNATDKYRPAKQIHVRQPAIVLLNREDAGSIIAEPVTESDRETAKYWKENAFVYIMGDDEYFYRRDTCNPTIHENNPYNSEKNINEERLGEPDEFEKMHQRFLAKQSKK